MVNAKNKTTASEICDQLKRFVSEEILDIGATDCTNLSFEDLGIQSLDILELVYFIESTYKCQLPRDVLREDNIASFERLAEFTYRFLNEKNGIQVARV